MMVAGVVIGLWFGLWWALIGGIVEIVGEIRAEQMQAGHLAWSILRVMLSGAIGYISAAILFLPGFVLANKD